MIATEWRWLHGFAAAEVFLPRGTRLPMHHHGDPALTLIADGSLIVRTAEQEVELVRGDVLLCPAPVEHANYASEDVRTLAVELLPGGLPELAAYLRGASAGDQFVVHGFLQRIDEVRDALARSGAGGDLALRGTILRLLGDVVDAARCIVAVEERNWFSDVIAYVAGNLQQSLSLATISSRVGLSRSSVAAAFRRETGMSAGQFIRVERLKAAAAQLLETELPIIEIALSVGFAEHAHFTRAFHRHYGMSPRDYRASWHRRAVQRKSG